MNETLTLASVIRLTTSSFPNGSATNDTFIWNGSAWTIGAVSTGSFTDSTFEVKDNGDPTKKIVFECSNISAATTRTLTIPNYNSILTAYGSGTPTLLTGNLTYPTITGSHNTGYGINALGSITSGARNTAMGFGSLATQTTVSDCTAFGYNALTLNSTGLFNVAVGTYALAANASTSYNTAVGFSALNGNIASFNTAVGYAALSTNTTGTDNTAVGFSALYATSDGNYNTAVGAAALYANNGGDRNTAFGYNALYANIGGNDNTTVGYQAGDLISSGSSNIVIGSSSDVSSDSQTNCIIIGTSFTPTTVDNSCFIKNIRGITTNVVDAIAVLIDSQGQLGTVSSSQRYKDNIMDMSDMTDALYNLRPVSFHYKTDQSKTTTYGLIAEEVEQVFPGLVVYKDIDGVRVPETVSYHLLPSLLLNMVQRLKTEIVSDKSHIMELTNKCATYETNINALTDEVSMHKATITTLMEKVNLILTQLSN